jgi:hypothetical protein
MTCQGPYSAVANENDLELQSIIRSTERQAALLVNTNHHGTIRMLRAWNTEVELAQGVMTGGIQ